MYPNEVVMHVEDCQRGNVVLGLLGESIGEPGEPAHAHTHGEILALHIAGIRQLHIWLADLGSLLAANAGGGAVAGLRDVLAWAPESLLNDGIVDIVRERRFDYPEVQPQAVRAQLNAMREAAGKIVDEQLGGDEIPLADLPGANQFGLGVDSDPCPAIARVRIAFQHLRSDVGLLRSDERPNFIALNPFALEVYEVLVHVL